MLNAYHVKFLHRLVQHEVAFLVIGGQARHFLDRDHRTRDLDIWVRIEPADEPKLNAVVDAWVQEHPQHGMALGPGRQWRSNVQVKFPECDGVWYRDLSDTVREIDTEDGIDVLTSLHDLDFDTCMRRARRNEVDGVAVLSLCPDDLGS